MIQIETKTPDLKRLAATLVLPRVDSGIQLLKDLIVARKQGSIEYFLVAQIDGGLYRFRRDDDALRLRFESFELEIGVGGLAISQ
ncbi:MAG: hypothetical protein ABSH47_24645 [Bryobacteraceae bacterium]